MRLETLEAARAWPLNTPFPALPDDAADHAASHSSAQRWAWPRPGDGPLLSTKMETFLSTAGSGTPWCSDDHSRSAG